MKLKILKIFLISPVRNITKKERIEIGEYVAKLERDGHIVHWPIRDTDQDDEIGLRILKDNYSAMEQADEIHIWWNNKSQGSVFDFGMAFVLYEMFDRKIVLANYRSVIRTSHKSFENVLLVLNNV